MTTVRLVFLRELDGPARVSLEPRLAELTLGPGQERFSRPGADVLASGREDPSRDTFAVEVLADERWLPVGIGVLQPHPPGTPQDQTAVVTFRGFSIDPHWQGRGVGTRATTLAARAARERFPAATTLRLTVHQDNVAGKKAYQRCGFSVVGQVMGRAGWEDVMHLPLADD